MAMMGHDENVAQSPTAIGSLNSSGWSVNFGSGSASAKGGPMDTTPTASAGLLNGLDMKTLILIGVIYMLWKGK